MSDDCMLIMVNNSLGEVNYILPYVIKLKLEKNISFYVYFGNNTVFKKAVDDPLYHDLIEGHGKIIAPADLLPFLLKRRHKVLAILKDTTPLTDRNIVFKVKRLCPRARIILFPNANTLLGYQFKTDEPPKTIPVEDREVDKVMYVHPEDVPVLATRYQSSKLLFAGALGYTKWWSDEVDKIVKANSHLRVTDPANPIIVLFTLRDVHKTFLSQENFDYLLKSAFDFMLNDERYFVIIKPHPRQKMAPLMEKLAHYERGRYLISHVNTLALAKCSDINLSLWSSSVTDCLAMGIPSVEFHKFHVKFNQNVDRDGELISINSQLNVTHSVSTRDMLERDFPKTRDEIRALYDQQVKYLEKIFTNVETGFDNFAAFVCDSRRKHEPSWRLKILTYIYFTYKYIFRTFKKA